MNRALKAIAVAADWSLNRIGSTGERQAKAAAKLTHPASAAAGPTPPTAAVTGPAGVSVVQPAPPAGSPTVTRSPVIGCHQCAERPWQVTFPSGVSRTICERHGLVARLTPVFMESGHDIGLNAASEFFPQHTRRPK